MCLPVCPHRETAYWRENGIRLSSVASVCLLDGVNRAARMFWGCEEYAPQFGWISVCVVDLLFCFWALFSSCNRPIKLSLLSAQSVLSKLKCLLFSLDCHHKGAQSSAFVFRFKGCYANITWESNGKTNPDKQTFSFGRGQGTGVKKTVAEEGEKEDGFVDREREKKDRREEPRVETGVE